MTTISLASDTIEQALTAMDDAGYIIGEDDLALTDTTIAEFAQARGRAADETTAAGNGMTVYVWNNVQTRKGAMRGDLVVIEVDGGSVSYFGGEV